MISRFYSSVSLYIPGCGSAERSCFFPQEPFHLLLMIFLLGKGHTCNGHVVCIHCAGLTRREIMEHCVDTFQEYMQEGQREGPERNRTRYHCLGTVLKPLGYLSSGARVGQ